MSKTRIHHPGSNFVIRYADESDLEQVNQLRRMVHLVHANGRPDIFKPYFGSGLKNHLSEQFNSPDADVIVALINNVVCGFAVVEYINRPETSYNLPRSFYRVEEFGVSPDYRRLGIATALVDFMKVEAAQKGYAKIELDMWEFNESALKFYNAAGFKTYRRYMELKI